MFKFKDKKEEQIENKKNIIDKDKNKKDEFDLTLNDEMQIDFDNDIFSVLKIHKKNNFLSIIPINGVSHITFSPLEYLNKVDMNCKKMYNVYNSLLNQKDVLDKDLRDFNTFLRNNIVHEDLGNIFFIFSLLNNQNNQHFNKSLIFFNTTKSKSNILEIKEWLEQKYNLKLDIFSFNFTKFNLFKDSYLELEENAINEKNKKLEQLENDLIPYQKERLNLFKLKIDKEKADVELEKATKRLEKIKRFNNDFLDNKQNCKSKEIDINKIESLTNQIKNNIVNIKNVIKNINCQIDDFY